MLLVKTVNFLKKHSNFYSSHDAKRCARCKDLCLFKQIPSEYSLTIA